MISIEVNKDDLADMERMPERLSSDMELLLQKVLDLSLLEIRSTFPRASGKSADSFFGRLERGEAGPKVFIESDWFVARLQEYGYKGHYTILPSGAKSWIPPKPLSKEGHHAFPAVLRVLENINHEIEEVIDQL